MRNNNKKGFTLVELVIVIAVIAILAAVLIPTFVTVIANANKSAATQEAHNLRNQITVAYAEQGGFNAWCEDVYKLNFSTEKNGVKGSENQDKTITLATANILFEGLDGYKSDDEIIPFKGIISEKVKTITVTKGTEDKFKDKYIITYDIGNDYAVTISDTELQVKAK